MFGILFNEAIGSSYVDQRGAREEFVPGRQQDASPAIRGFLYQLQLTLDRWLDLGQDDVLILECGEDIDRLVGASDRTSRHRILEQVKATRRRITLRSPTALRSLAHFAEHRAANTGHRLRFQYTTTATPGRERLVTLPGSMTGIDLWETTRASTNPDEEALASLAELLVGARKPDNCSLAAWRELQSVLADAERFWDFVQCFSWCCGQADPGTMQGKLIKRLAEREDAESACSDEPAVTGQRRYDQLLTHLLSVLSGSDEKRLTGQDLDDLFRAPTLATHDRSRLALLETQVEGHRKTLEDFMAERGRTLSGILPLWGTAVPDSRSLPAPPVLATRLVSREDTVAQLVATLDQHDWLVLYGAYGVGKSHLAQLVCAQVGPVALGVGLRGLSEEAAERVLSIVLCDEVGWDSLESSTGVVLLDDTPMTDHGSQLEGVLCQFVQRAVSAGRQVVSTMRQPPDALLMQRSGVSHVAVESPPFTASEARNLVCLHCTIDAPADLAATLDAAIDMCRGHPLLITALAEYLSKAEDMNAALSDVLSRHAHRDTLDLEIARALWETIEVQQCRELLYRLALVKVPLTNSEAREVASIPPSLPEPSQCLSRLDGLWLRRDADRRLAVIPPAESLGCELAQAVKERIYGVAARLILQRGKGGIREFLFAIGSLIAAGEATEAARVLVSVFLQAQRSAREQDALGLLFFFPVNEGDPLDRAVELPLRAAQTVVSCATGHDPSAYTERLRHLTHDAPSVDIAAAGLAGAILTSSASELNTTIAILGAQLVEQWLASGVDVPEHLAPSNYEPMHIFVIAGTIKTWDDIASLIHFLSTLSEARRETVVDASAFCEVLRHITFRPLFTSDGNFVSGASARLAGLSQQAREAGLVLLAAYLKAAQMIVHGDREHDIDTILELARDAHDCTEGHVAAQCVIDATVGQQLMLVRRSEEAISLLQPAISRGNFVGAERAIRLSDALTAAWDVDNDCGPYLDGIAEYLDSCDFWDTEVARLHGRVAVGRWREDGRVVALDHLERGLVALIECEEDTPVWKHTMWAFAAMLTWYSEEAESRDPVRVGTDGEELAAPQPRMFLGIREEIAALYRPEIIMTAQMQIGRIAAALGDQMREARWIGEAFEAAKTARLPSIVSITGTYAVHSAVRQRDWAAGAEASLITSRAHVVGMRMREEHLGIFETADFEPYAHPTRPSECQDVEREALQIFTAALVIALGGLAAERWTEARDTAGEAAEQLDGVTNIVSDPAPWNALGALLREFGSSDVSGRRIQDLMATRPDSPGAEACRFVAHGVFAFSEEVPMRQQVASQLSAVRRLSDLTSCPRYVETYYSAVIGYWLRRVQEASGLFSMPYLLRESLEAGCDNPQVTGFKRCMRVLTRSVGVRFEDELGDWLRDS